MTTNYPTTLDSYTGASPKGFGAQVNLLSYTLNGSHAIGSTTLTVNEATTLAPTAGYLGLDNRASAEVVSYTGKTTNSFTGVSATTVVHSNNTRVGVVPVAEHHNDVAQAIVAVETKLGAGDYQVFVNIMEYGAHPDNPAGTNTPLIQAAIDALPLTGGKLIVPGYFKINATLTFGNGSGAAQSTRNGITIEGLGSGTDAGELSGGTHVSGFEWRGSAGSTMLQLNGPIANLQVRGLYFNCKGSSNAAATAILASHVHKGRFEDILVEKHSGVPIDVTAYEAPTGVVTGSGDTVWMQVYFANPTGTSDGGIRIGSDTYADSPHLDVARHAFYSCQFRPSSSTKNSVELRFSDALSFFNCYGGGKLTLTSPSGSTSYPGGIALFNSPFLGGIGGAGSTTHRLVALPWPTGDSEPIPDKRYALGITDQGEVFGYWVGLPAMYGQIANSNTISNTSLATAFSKTYSIEANEANRIGALIKLRAWGEYVVASLTDYLLALQIGGFGFSQATIAGVGVGNGTWEITGFARVRTTGATGTVAKSGGVLHLGSSSAISTLTGTQALDLTGTLTAQAAVVMSVANSGNTITLEDFSVEVVHPKSTS